jgi:hypothetical protein
MTGVLSGPWRTVRRLSGAGGLYGMYGVTTYVTTGPTGTRAT